MFKITEKQKLNQQVTMMKIQAPLVANKVQPGQFIILKIDEHGERIPLTVADFDRDAGTVTIIFQAVGNTTKMLAQMNQGDYIQDFVGPLGNPTEFGNPKKAIVVGGGVGCAIAYPQAKALYNMGTHVDIIAGFRNRDLIFFEDEMRKVCNNLYITTDDGSYGRKGLVTDVLKELLSVDKYDLVIAIGPIPMMKFVSLVTKEYNVKTIVSLNPIMIDGTGMCGGCRVTVDGKIRFACVEGPDFDGHQVDFDELMLRNRTFVSEEMRDHTCRIGLGG
ncbi:MAG TPA: sulfide/dihydroorotate dehydrogenase-like FAD/NAD-binding protein [Clostridiales bacterium]|nr:sulfide/dihydroorotate dehydrogenase-like FAD/NAD-binding protein [Clostridiales bacterium]